MVMFEVPFKKVALRAKLWLIKRAGERLTETRLKEKTLLKRLTGLTRRDAVLVRPLIQEREPYATVYQIFMAHQTRHLRRRLWVEWLESLTSRMRRANISAVVKMPKKDGQINKLTVRKQRRPWSGTPLIGRPLSAVVKCSLIKGINEHQWTSMNSVQWILSIG